MIYPVSGVKKNPPPLWETETTKNSCPTALNSNINPQQAKVKWLRKINSFFHALLPNAPYWRYSKKEKGYCLQSPRNVLNQKPGLINKQLNYVMPERKPPAKENLIDRALLPYVKKLTERALTIEELHKCMNIIYRGIYTLQVTDSQGNCSVFEGNQKGTERYNKKQRGKILDLCSTFVAQKMKACFLTLTCDPKQYKSRSNAWANYVDLEIHPALENLRKHYGVKYVATLESTLNGFPHAHIILFIPQEKFPEIDKLKNKQKILNGALFNLIKNNLKSPIFCLERAKGKGLKWYLTKYISKGIENNIFSTLDKSKKITKSDVKELQEFVYLRMFHRRKLLYTRPQKTAKERQESRKCFIEQNRIKALILKAQNPQENPAVRRKSATKLRAYLTSICANSPYKDYQEVYTLSYAQYKQIFKTSCFRNDEVSDAQRAEFIANGTLSSYTHNFYTDFCALLDDPVINPLNHKTHIDGQTGDFTRMSDGYDLEDPCQWLLYITNVISFHFHQIFVCGESMERITKNLEGLSQVRKQIYFERTKQSVDVRSYDPKEEFVSVDDLNDLRAGKITPEQFFAKSVTVLP